MLPSASNQSSLRCPLNEVFGSRGQVRLLRVLSTAPHRPFLPAEAATRAGMTESGARKALQRLSRTGLVERTGNGEKNQFVFYGEGALAQEVARLFQVERERGEALAQALRKTIGGLSNPPEIAWVQDFLGGWKDLQEVAVFCPGETSVECVEALRERLVAVEREFAVSLEVRTCSAGELDEVNWPEVVVLRGTPPGATVASSTEDVSEKNPGDNPFSPAGKLNPESPEFSGALVALLEENLSVLRRARENVRGRLGESRNGHSHDLWEWQKILDTFSFPRLLHFLESDSPRAVRLRESSPFPAVLSEKEKARLAELASAPHSRNVM
ncbi:MAG: MarR family transcriptional regulator [Longimicrobiales bacterium]